MKNSIRDTNIFVYFCPWSDNCAHTFAQISMWRIFRSCFFYVPRYCGKYHPEPGISADLHIWSFVFQAKWVMMWTAHRAAHSTPVPSSVDFSMCGCKLHHVDIHRVRNMTPMTCPLKRSRLPKLMNDFFYMKTERGGIAMSHFWSIIDCIFQPTIPISIHRLR